MRDERGMRAAFAVLVLAVVAAGAAGCASGGSDGAPVATTGGVAGASTTLTPAAAAGAGDVCRGGRTVRLQVLKSANGSTLVLVPVTIGGKGPYPFALDTGASKSAIDIQLARKLGLKQVGATNNVNGIAGASKAKILHVEDWRAGAVQLGADDLASLDLFGGQSGPVGLLGSDVLSRFSSICIDYRAKTLRLGGR